MSEDRGRYGRNLREAADDARKLPRGMRRSAALRGASINGNDVRPARRSGLCGLCGDAFVLDDLIVWCHELASPSWAHADCARPADAGPACPNPGEAQSSKAVPGGRSTEGGPE